MAEKFGSLVKIRYVDVIDDDMDEYPEIDEYLRKAGTRVLPLLVVDGRILNPGTGLNYKEILDVLREMGVMKEEPTFH